MAVEQKPQPTPPNSSHLADNPHPCSPLERMLRAALRLRRASIHFGYVADELQAARAEIDAARVALPAVQPRAHAAHLAVQCTERCWDARAQAEAFAQYAKCAEDLAGATRGVSCAQLDDDIPQNLSAASATGEMGVVVDVAQEGRAR